MLCNYTERRKVVNISRNSSSRTVQHSLLLRLEHLDSLRVVQRVPPPVVPSRPGDHGTRHEYQLYVVTERFFPFVLLPFRKSRREKRKGVRVETGVTTSFRSEWTSFRIYYR